MVNDGEKLVVAIVFLALFVCGAELLGWVYHRKLPNRMSATKRGALYAVLSAFLLAAILFPEVGRAVDSVQRYMWIGLLVVAVLLFALVRIGIPSINKTFQEARELDEAGRTLDAITLLEKARPVARRWDNSLEAIVLCNIASFYAKLRDWPQALATVEEAISINPNHATLYATKAEVLCESGSNEKAAEMLAQIVPRFEKSVALQTAWAEIQLKVGRISDAQNSLAHTEQLLDNEKAVDVLDRDDWRKLKLEPIRQRLDAEIAKNGQAD